MYNLILQYILSFYDVLCALRVTTNNSIAFLYTLDECITIWVLMHGRIQTNKPSIDEYTNMVTLINKTVLLYLYSKTMASDITQQKKVFTHWFWSGREIRTFWTENTINRVCTKIFTITMTDKHCYLCALVLLVHHRNQLQYYVLVYAENRNISFMYLAYLGIYPWLEFRSILLIYTFFLTFYTIKHLHTFQTTECLHVKAFSFTHVTDNIHFCSFCLTCCVSSGERCPRWPRVFLSKAKVTRRCLHWRDAGRHLSCLWAVSCDRSTLRITCK